MNDIEEFEDAVLVLMGHPKWAIIQRGLELEAQQRLLLAGLAPSWELTNQHRGEAQGIAYVANLRDTIIQQRENNDAV